jgi:hypothetical protein
MAIPSLAMIPSGYKATKLYSVLPTDGVGDFTVSRPTGGAGTTGNATRVNSAGLLETVAPNVPRLDYSDGGCPVLLTEPQSTNLVIRSNELENIEWTKSKVTPSDNSVISPKGNLDGTRLLETAEVGDHAILNTGKSVVAGDTYTVSSYIKPNGRNIAIAGFGAGFTNGFRANFDTTTFTLINITTQGDGVVVSGKIEAKANGWYRVSVTGSLPTDITMRHVVYLLDGTSQTYLGDITKGVDLYGAQLEPLNFVSTFINTTETAITRVADVVKDAGDVNTFNSIEGTLFVECAVNVNDLSLNNFSITNGLDGSSKNSVVIRSNDASNEYLAIIQLAGVYPVTIASTVADITDFNKLAFSYKENDFKFYINGVLVGTDTVGGVPAIGTYDEFSFSSGGSNAGSGTFYGKTKQIQVYNTALSDAELIALTS